MQISIANAILVARLVGKSIVRRGLKMWLDFKKSNIIGCELVVNGDFKDGEDYWIFSNATLNLGGAEINNIGLSNANAFIQSTDVAVLGSTYKVTYDVLETNGKNLVIEQATSIYLETDTVGVNREVVFEWTKTTAGKLAIKRIVAETKVTIDNIRLQEVAQFAPDKSTNTNNAKLFTGKALSFNGNDYVSGLPSPTSQMTLSLWVHPTSSAKGGLITWDNSGGNHDYDFVLFRNASGKLVAKWDTDTVDGTEVTSVSNVPEDVWTRIVVSQDSNTFKMYIDGQFDVSASIPANLSGSMVGVIGRMYANTYATENYFNGKLSDIQIYNSAWDSDDAAYDYANPNNLVTDNPNTSITLSNLSAYYALSEGSGSIAYDSSGEGNSGNVYDGSILGATYVLKQPTIPQLGMMDWSKGSNLFVNSQVFTAWIRGNTSLTSNNTTSPLGDQTGSTLTTTNNGSTFYISSNVVASTSYTFSFYVKRGNMSGLKYRIYDNSNTNNIVAPTSYYSETSASAWVRVSKTFTTPSGCTSIRTYIISDSASTGTVRIWGSQLEESSTLGSYIGTSGSSASNATLIQNPNDLGKDVLGNALRLREGGFNLDGSGYAEVADDSSLDFGTGAFSMECWVRADYTSKGSSYNTILTLGGDPRGAGSAGLVSDDFQLYAYINGSFMRANSNYTNGDWYHIASTRDSGGACKLYIDSIAQTLTSTTTGDITNALVKTIGNDTINGREYENIIDDLRLYSQALSQKEIDNNYKIGLSKHS